MVRIFKILLGQIYKILVVRPEFLCKQISIFFKIKLKAALSFKTSEYILYNLR